MIFESQPEVPDPREVAKRKEKVRRRINAKWRELAPHLETIARCAVTGPTNLGEAAITHQALALVVGELRFMAQEDLELRLFMDPNRTTDGNPEDETDG